MDERASDADREATLELRTVLGSVEVLVLHGARVEVEGSGVMCSVDLRLDREPPPPGARRLRR